MIYFFSKPSFFLSSSSEEGMQTEIVRPIKRGRGRPPKIKTPEAENSTHTPSINPTLCPEPFLGNASHNSKLPITAMPTTSIVECENMEALSLEQENYYNEFPAEIPDEENMSGDEGYEQFGYSPQPSEDDIESGYDREPEMPRNSVSLSFSWSIMSQLRQMARNEGVGIEDLVGEFVVEGLTRRAFEDQMRPAPSHLMTRTGYVHNDGTQLPPQPQLSHHNTMNPNRQQGPSHPQARNNRFPFQNRNHNNYQQNRQMNMRNNNGGYNSPNGNQRQGHNNQQNYRNTHNNIQQNQNSIQQQRYNNRQNGQSNQYDESNENNRYNNRPRDFSHKQR